MTVTKTDTIGLLYVAVAILLAIAIKLNVDTNKIRAPADNRFPACYSNVCFA